MVLLMRNEIKGMKKMPPPKKRGQSDFLYSCGELRCWEGTQLSGRNLGFEKDVLKNKDILNWLIGK